MTAKPRITLDFEAAMSQGKTEGLERLEKINSRPKVAIQNKGGRPPIENAQKIQLKLPVELVKAIKLEALNTGKLESVIVAEWLKGHY